MKSYLCSIIVLAGLIMLFASNYEWSSLLIISAFTLFILQNKGFWLETPYFGIANLITTIRLLLVLVLIFFSGRLSFNDSKVFLLILVIPLLDIIDGLIARYRKEESQFGMFYDMEVDAVFVMVASILVYLNHSAMWIVLIPAFLRYLYKFFLDIYNPNNTFIEKKQKYASLIAGNYFVALIVFNIVDHEISKWYLSISSILIIFSFIKSALELIRWKQAYDLPC
jgi:phosphatidylglycerophosphate synthase